MAIGKRCGVCNINWPDLQSYEVCPGCDGATTRRTDLDEPALTASKAQYKRKEIKFEEYCAQRGPRPLAREHAQEVALTLAKTEAQHQLEMWWRLKYENV